LSSSSACGACVLDSRRGQLTNSSGASKTSRNGSRRLRLQSGKRYGDDAAPDRAPPAIATVYRARSPAPFLWHHQTWTACLGIQITRYREHGVANLFSIEAAAIEAPEQLVIGIFFEPGGFFRDGRTLTIRVAARMSR